MFDYYYYYLNCRSLSNNLPEISLLLAQTKLSVLALTETWLNDDQASNINIPGFTFVHRSGSEVEPCAGRAAAADNLWAPPPTFVDRRAADNLSARRRYHCCCVVIFWEFSMTSSLSSLPSGRSRPPMVSCFSMLSFFFKFAVFLAHHPVQ